MGKDVTAEFVGSAEGRPFENWLNLWREGVARNIHLDSANNCTMSDLPLRLGIPDTQPPRTFGELRAYAWFGGIGLLLCLLGVFSQIVVARWLIVGLMAGWVLVGARELRKPRTMDRTTGVLYRNCVGVVLAFCAGYSIWAWQLGLPWQAVVGGLLLIDAFANSLAAVTEWWRLSLIGHAAGLAICGFGFPFVEPMKLGLLMGASLLLGSSLSAAILYWQVRTTGNMAEHTMASTDEAGAS